MLTTRLHLTSLLLILLTLSGLAADLPGTKDPSGVKRYEGSEIIAYLAPTFTEYFTVGRKDVNVAKDVIRLEGEVTRWTYLVPDTTRTSLEVFKNYQNEFTRLGLEIVWTAQPGGRSAIKPFSSYWDKTARLGRIFEGSAAEERYLLAKSTEPNPTYYAVFVTTYKKAVSLPDNLKDRLAPGMPLVQFDIIAPKKMEDKMVLVKAEEMQRSLESEGRIALYGLYFDTAKDTLKADSTPSLEEIAKLLQASPSLKVYIVGHTDNQGAPDYNLQLSERRAASVVRSLVENHGITAGRLTSHGAGLFCPIASNADEAGRAKNRRVELVLP